MTITEDVLQEFKDRMRLGDGEDNNLKRILSASHSALLRDCGNYDILHDERFKELVFERARYAYNDALEYFAENFQTEITTLGMAKVLDDMPLEDDVNATE